MVVARVDVVARVVGVSRGAGYAAAADGTWPVVRVGARVLVVVPRMAEALGIATADLEEAIEREVARSTPGPRRTGRPRRVAPAGGGAA